MAAPEVPRQEALVQAPAFSSDGHVARAVARFSVEALVLSAERYRFDREARVAPVDLALGWGPMSDAAVVGQIRISQSRRFYWWSVKRFPIPRRAIVEHSANMHMIPANENVRQSLLDVDRGDVVAIEGYLVNVEGDDGWSWRTSTTRQDSGAGACEIVWVEEIRVLE